MKKTKQRVSEHSERSAVGKKENYLFNKSKRGASRAPASYSGANVEKIDSVCVGGDSEKSQNEKIKYISNGFERCGNCRYAEQCKIEDSDFNKTDKCREWSESDTVEKCVECKFCITGNYALGCKKWNGTSRPHYSVSCRSFEKRQSEKIRKDKFGRIKKGGAK